MMMMMMKRKDRTGGGGGEGRKYNRTHKILQDILLVHNWTLLPIRGCLSSSQGHHHTYAKTL